MKIAGVIAKILTALAAVIGAVYVLATYGEKIVEWAKGVWASMPKCECIDETEETEEAVEEAAEEDTVADVIEEVVEEAAEAVEEVVEEIAEDVVADEADFEG